MHYKSYSDLSHDIKSKLPELIKGDYDLVIGIPRSGMIPAFMIAFNLNINCTSIDSYINNDPPKHGITRSPNKVVNLPWEAKKVLLVDDSIKSGKSLVNAMERIPVHLRANITTLAVYTGQSGMEKVDLYIQYLPWPRMFEWNILYHTALPYYCLTIDGLLCEKVDNRNYLNDEEYRINLANANPLVLPNTHIHSLVTNRLEKYRAETEAWLKKYNINYGELIMLNNPSNLKTSLYDKGVKNKAAYYKKSNTILFVESDPVQALKISKLALKPVFCFADNKMYVPKPFDLVKSDPMYLPKEVKRLAKKLIFFVLGRNGSPITKTVSQSEKLELLKKIA